MSVRLSTVREYEYSKDPYFTISGKWLLEGGFKSGSRFVIEITKDGELVLKIVEEEI